MSKENIQRCLPTLSYAPVVGHLIDKLDEDGNPTGEKVILASEEKADGSCG